jgi:riboflavin kinase/FMN adenylyltransferase
MQVTYGSHQWKKSSAPVVMTLGNFDGVHRGHQFIFHDVIRMAQAHQALSMVYTFDPHPVTLLSPHTPLTLIQTLPQRLAAIASHQIDHTIVETFTRDFAHLSAEAFFADIIVDRIGPRAIVVGYDFTFGVHREGNAERLAQFGKQHGIPVHIIPAQFDGETLLSSSTVRQRIQVGDVSGATQLLGRPYDMSGTIVKGRGMGRQLGFATANLSPTNECPPAPGIYVTRFLYDHLNEPAVTYVGRNPTLGETPLSIETHVLGPVPELLGKQATVRFFHRIRGEKKFSGPEELARAIAQDCQEALTYHAAHS